MKRIALCLLATIFPNLGKSADNFSTVWKKPNFVFLLSDDQDWTGTSVQMHPDISGSKNQWVETPNLERLAEEGMIFSAAYSPAPVCSPTRISLQTGKSCAQLKRTKAAPVVTARENYPLLGAEQIRRIPSDEITIAEILKTVGYATAHYGKWHLEGGGPEAHGYDESDGDTGNKDAAPFVDPNPVDIFGMGERAIAFMEEQSKAGTPFFIQMSYHALHYPENALEVTQEKYRQKMSGRKTKEIQRAAIAENLDAGIGQLLQKMDELGIATNTYVTYMSDNGGGGGGKHRPLSGGKGDLREGGIRVPLIIRGPGVKNGVYCDTRVVGFDLFPTFYKLAGVEKPLPDGIEGGDIAELFGDAQGTVERPREELVFHFPHYQGDTPQSAILLGEYKLIKWYETGNVALFDLSKDIGERNDLSAELPEKTAELKRRLENYLEEVDANLPLPNSAYDASKPSADQKGGKDGRKRS